MCMYACIYIYIYMYMYICIILIITIEEKGPRYLMGNHLSIITSDVKTWLE